MKKKILLVLIIVAVCFSFASCTKVYESIPVYIYALGIESDSNGVKLHAVYKSGDDNKSDGGNKDGEGKETGEDKGTEVKVKTFGGKDIEKAVKKMFSQYKNIYTGTIKWYILEDDENTTKDAFIKYTVNSTSLPLKRKIAIKDNVYEYITEFKEQLCR